MAAQVCPMCSAPAQPIAVNALESCGWCGALLAHDPLPVGVVLAGPRVDQRMARVSVQNRLGNAAAEWSTGKGELIFYPFALTGDNRRPFEPLAGLPPLIHDGWRPSGTSLSPVGLDRGDERSISAEVRGATRVPWSVDAGEVERVVQYPFHRIPLVGNGGKSAAWCDAVDGQVMLPDDLRSSGRFADRAQFQRWICGGGAVGLACGLLLPSPVAQVTAAVSIAAFWWMAGR